MHVVTLAAPFYNDPYLMIFRHGKATRLVTLGKLYLQTDRDRLKKTSLMWKVILRGKKSF